MFVGTYYVSLTTVLLSFTKDGKEKVFKMKTLTINILPRF